MLVEVELPKGRAGGGVEGVQITRAVAGQQDRAALHLADGDGRADGRGHRSAPMLATRRGIEGIDGAVVGADKEAAREDGGLGAHGGATGEAKGPLQLQVGDRGGG